MDVEAIPAIENVAPSPFPPPRRRTPLRAILFGLTFAVVVAAVGLAVRHFQNEARNPSTDDAYVAGDVTPISARISGRIVEVRVREHQAVRAGQVLVVLDPTDADLRVRQAEAALAVVRARVPQAEAALLAQQSQAAAAVAQANAAMAASNARVPQAESGVEIARRQIEAQEQQARAALRSAQARATAAEAQAAAQSSQVESARANVIAAQSSVERTQVDFQRAQRLFAEGAVSSQQVDAARAAVREAEAQVAAARESLLSTRIAAPANGVASQVRAQIGQTVDANQPLLALVLGKAKWIVANYKETQIRRIRVGQPATVYVDALGRSFRGRVISIGAAASSTFSLLPPENASGNFVKVVQRVPVRIAIEEDPDEALQIRLSVVAVVHTGEPELRAAPR
jgi:membrane fusion protein (multidrug efflux system)